MGLAVTSWIWLGQRPSLNLVGLSEALWGSLVLSGALWSLGLSRTLWRSLALSGVLWCSMGLSGALGELLGALGEASWELLGSGALWGFSLIFFDFH